MGASLNVGSSSEDIANDWQTLRINHIRITVSGKDSYELLTNLQAALPEYLSKSLGNEGFARLKAQIPDFDCFILLLAGAMIHYAASEGKQRYVRTFSDDALNCRPVSRQDQALVSLLMEDFSFQDSDAVRSQKIKKGAKTFVQKLWHKIFNPNIPDPDTRGGGGPGVRA